MSNDLRFKVDELFSDIVDQEEHTIILLEHNKRYIYTANKDYVLAYYTDNFGYIHYALTRVGSEAAIHDWQYIKIRKHTVEYYVNEIYDQYKREG